MSITFLICLTLKELLLVESIYNFMVRIGLTTANKDSAVKNWKIRIFKDANDLLISSKNY